MVCPLLCQKFAFKWQLLGHPVAFLGSVPGDMPISALWSFRGGTTSSIILWFSGVLCARQGLLRLHVVAVQLYFLKCQPTSLYFDVLDFIVASNYCFNFLLPNLYFQNGAMCGANGRHDDWL